MSDPQDPSDPHNRTKPEGPSVVYLRMPGLSRLPPDAWFEDEFGDAEMVRVEEERLARLRSRRSSG